MKTFLKIGVFFVIIIGILFLAGIDQAYAAEPRVSFVHGEIMDNNEIYPTEWIGIIFSEPLKNNSGQATKAIQKAVNRSFGSGKAVVETQDNVSFIINIKSKIKLNDDSIKLPLKSIKDAATSEYNSYEIFIPIAMGNQELQNADPEEDSTVDSSSIPPDASVTALSGNDSSAPATAPVSDNSYPGQLFYNGSTGDNVRKIQSKLKEKGYDAGTEDGIFGRITTSAVKSFQKAKNLDVDGIVGPITWPALFGIGVMYKRIKEDE